MKEEAVRPAEGVFPALGGPHPPSQTLRGGWECQEENGEGGAGVAGGGYRVPLIDPRTKRVMDRLVCDLFEAREAWGGGRVILHCAAWGCDVLGELGRQNVLRRRRLYHNLGEKRGRQS